MTVKRPFDRCSTFGLLIGAIVLMGVFFGLQAREGHVVSLGRLTTEQEMSRTGAGFWNDTSDCKPTTGGCLLLTNPAINVACPAGTALGARCMKVPKWNAGGPVNRACTTVAPQWGLPCFLEPMAPCIFKYSLCDATGFCGDEGPAENEQWVTNCDDRLFQ
jgi:hypothetical protein